MDAVANRHEDPPVSAELTLEAALAFVEDCSLDSDEEADPAAAGRQAKSRVARNRSSSSSSAAAAAPPSPRFFELVDSFADGNDSEGVSLEDALEMLDTYEIADAGRQQHKGQVTQRATFSELVHGAVSPTGSYDSDASIDSSTKTASSTTSAAGSSAQKPRQRAVGSAIANKSKTSGNSAKARATLRTNVEKTAPDAVTDKAATDKTAMSTTTAKPTKKRVRRQREELLYLREKVVEMQQVLDSMQKVDKSPSESADSSSPTTAVSSPTAGFDPEAALIEQMQQQSSISLSPCNVDSSSTGSQICNAAWEALAERQLQERERAELENRQLKATLEGQIKLVQSLEQLLIGPLDIELPGLSNQTKRVKTHIGDDRVDDSVILCEIKQELAKAYSRFEQDFATSYLRDLWSDNSDVQVRTTPGQGMHVEFTASKVVQHSFEITRRGVWRFMSVDGMARQCFYHKELEEPTANFIARDFGCRLERAHRDVDIHGKQVLKRIEQERRDVFLWTAVVQPVKFSDAPSAKGVRFRERGWLVMEPAVGDDGSVSKNATIIKTFTTFTPDLGENVSAKSLAVGAITDLVLDSVEGNIHFCQGMVSHLILEDEHCFFSKNGEVGITV